MSRFHSRTRSAWRVGAVLLFLAGIVMSVGAPGVGAQTLTCSDFNDPEAAQFFLYHDPSHAETLDADGDGIACNEDDDRGSSDDVADPEVYLEDVRTQVELLQDDLVRFSEIDTALQDPTLSDAEVDALVEESFGIIDLWLIYPDIAFIVEMQAPADYEDISEAHHDLADTVAEAGNLLYDAIDAEPESAEQVELLMEFGDAYDSALMATDELLDMIDDAADEVDG